MDWSWWILGALPFPHLVRVMDCFFHEGMKVLYRVSLAILILFNKHANTANSEWGSDSIKNDIDNVSQEISLEIQEFNFNRLFSGTTQVLQKHSCVTHQAHEDGVQYSRAEVAFLVIYGIV